MLVGVGAFGPMVPVIGGTLGAGTGAEELTPRLLISVESSGIPARAPGVDVEVDDEVTMLEPEPHMPDKPAVAVVPEIPDNPEVADIPDASWVVDVAGDGLAGGTVPFSVTPPPS